MRQGTDKSDLRVARIMMVMMREIMEIDAPI